jgi:50S ribosomal subunit-associated GTPase HflX
MLRAEVALYSPDMAALPALCVANKADLLARPAATLRALRARAGGARVVAASALRGDGVADVGAALRELVQAQEGGKQGAGKQGEV